MKVLNLAIINIISCLFPALAQLNEADFFTPPLPGGATINITASPYNAIGTDTIDDSAALQMAIDDANANPLGGTITIPAGNFYFFQIQMKSNVHIEVDNGATLFTLPNGNDVSLMFDFNARNLPIIENTSIIGVGGSFTVDFREFGVDVNGVEDRIRFISCSNVTNFQFSNFTILDNFTMFPSISFNVTKDDTGADSRPDKGLIKNIIQTNSNYGYGIAQLQSAANLLFKDLDCIGGVTLRLESGNETTAVSNLKIDQVFGRNIINRIGQAALQLQPHTDDHGFIDVRDITAIDCEFAVKIDPGFLNDRDRTNGRTETGSFDSTSIIRDVKATTTEADTSIRRQFLRFLPCQYRPEVQALDINPSNTVIIGKALAPALNFAAYKLIDATTLTYSNDPGDFTPDDGHYIIDFSDADVTATGYLFFIPNVLKFETDDYENCDPAIDPALGFNLFFPGGTRNTPHSITGADPADGSTPIDPVLSINDNTIAKLSSFEIYPNPTSDVLNIIIEESVTLNIYTISGRFIENYNFEANQAKKIPVNKLAKGIYLLEIKTEKTTTSEIFVKN